jgi:hypothetical protein
MKILVDLLSSKNGDELFEKVQKLLDKFGINVCNADGTVKDLYTVLCEVAEVMNNNTK